MASTVGAVLPFEKWPTWLPLGALQLQLCAQTYKNLHWARTHGCALSLRRRQFWPESGFREIGSQFALVASGEPKSIIGLTTLSFH